jgi:hypothetical protein
MLMARRPVATSGGGGRLEGTAESRVSATMYPTKESFAQLILYQPLEQVVRDHIFAGMPFAFRDRPQALHTLKAHLASRLRVSEANVIVVGSGRIGFSLSPDTFFRGFSADSDLDILVVDDRLFDVIWCTLLKWNYPSRGQLGGHDWEWAKGRREDIFWGRFMPHKIRFRGLSFPRTLAPVRNLCTAWFDAFGSLSRYSEHPEFATRHVSGYLYRTWDHALEYHVEGLRLIQAAIRQGSEKGFKT